MPLEVRFVLWTQCGQRQGQGREEGGSSTTGKGELQKGRKRTTEVYILKTVVKAPYSNIIILKTMKNNTEAGAI